MSKHRDYATNDVLSAGFLDALNEFVSTDASPFVVDQPSTTSLRIQASTGNAQVSLAVGGAWRFITSNVTASAPANAAGEYPIYAVSAVNNTGQEDAGTFAYGFTLKLSVAPTGSGAEALSRTIGFYGWDGSAITYVRQLVGVPSRGNPTTTGPPLVTSMPVGAPDGFEVRYLADATNGIVWTFRFRSGSASAYKWEFTGGSPLVAFVDTMESRSLASFGDLATVGPSVTAPLAGDYLITVGAMVTDNSNSYVQGVMSYAVGATAADSNDGIDARLGAPGAALNSMVTMAAERRKTGLAAATAIVAKYQAYEAGNTCFWLNRRLTAVPIRVS